MRQAITTKYLGPSNVRGSRIKAIARKKSIMGAEMSATVPHDYRGQDEMHCHAAKTLAEKLGWSGLWIGGGNVDEIGNVFVNVRKPTLAMRWPDEFGVEGRDWFFVAEQRPKHPE